VPLIGSGNGIAVALRKICSFLLMPVAHNTSVPCDNGDDDDDDDDDTRQDNSVV